MAAVAGQAGERLRHEGGAQAVLLGDRLDHELEEGVPVGGDQRVVEVPVHLELAVGVLVVVLVRAPAELQHVVADLGDDVVAAHQRLLVVAGLRLRCRMSSEIAVPSGVIRKNSASTPVLTCRPCLGRLGDARFFSTSRGACATVLAVHHAVGGDPGDLRLPRQLDDRLRIGHAEQVGMGRRHVEPGGEAGEAGAVLLHVGDRLRPAPAWRAGRRTGRCRRSGST